MAYFATMLAVGATLCIPLPCIGLDEAFGERAAYRRRAKAKRSR